MVLAYYGITKYHDIVIIIKFYIVYTFTSVHQSLQMVPTSKMQYYC